MPMQLTKQRYTRLQVLIIVSSILVYVFINRDELTTMEGWTNFAIYVGFNLLIAMTGQSVGSLKETVRSLQNIIDGPGSAESKLNEAEHQLKLVANIAGIAWERYNREVKKRYKKILEQQKKMGKK